MDGEVEKTSMSAVLELTGTSFFYVLGKKDIRCLKEFILATDKGAGKDENGGFSMMGTQSIRNIYCF